MPISFAHVDIGMVFVGFCLACSIFGSLLEFDGICTCWYSPWCFLLSCDGQKCHLATMPLEMLKAIATTDTPSLAGNHMARRFQSKGRHHMGHTLPHHTLQIVTSSFVSIQHQKPIIVHVTLTASYNPMHAIQIGNTAQLQATWDSIGLFHFWLFANDRVSKSSASLDSTSEKSTLRSSSEEKSESSSKVCIEPSLSVAVAVEPKHFSASILWRRKLQLGGGNSRQVRLENINSNNHAIKLCPIAHSASCFDSGDEFVGTWRLMAGPAMAIPRFACSNSSASENALNERECGADIPNGINNDTDGNGRAFEHLQSFHH